MASFVIGVMGKKRSGKDTFASQLIDVHGFTQVRFADPLRAMLKALDPIVDARATVGGDYGYGGEWFPGPGEPEMITLTEVLGSDDDWETAKELPEVRRLMQRIGTEAGRGVLGEHVWVDAAQETLRKIDGPAVITDVRFPNEYNFVENVLSGWTVRISRPSLIRPAILEHASETALDGFFPRYEIINDGTIEELHAAADAVVADWSAYDAAGILQHSVI